MDNIILVSFGVIVLGIVFLVWIIMKIRQADSIDQNEDDGDDPDGSLISLSKPASAKQDLNMETRPASSQGAGILSPALDESIKNIERKLEFMDGTLKSLSQAIGETKAQSSGGTQLANELKGVLDSISVKVENIAKTTAAGGGAGQGGTSQVIMTELLNLVKAMANKVNNFETVLEQRSAEPSAGGGMNVELINQRVEDLKQTLLGLRDGGEEILSQITNKLDILNKIITTHITQSNQR